MKKEQKSGFSVVGIIVVIAVVAILGGGFLYFRELQRLKDLAAPPPAPATRNQQVQQPAPPAKSAELDTSTWKTYRNEKYGFEVRYPPLFIKVGENSDNSVLGTAQEPIGGIYIGPFVFIVAASTDLKDKAQDYF